MLAGWRGRPPARRAVLMGGRAPAGSAGRRERRSARGAAGGAEGGFIRPRHRICGVRQESWPFHIRKLRRDLRRGRRRFRPVFRFRFQNRWNSVVGGALLDPADHEIPPLRPLADLELSQFNNRDHRGTNHIEQENHHHEPDQVRVVPVFFLPCVELDGVDEDHADATEKKGRRGEVGHHRGEVEHPVRHRAADRVQLQDLLLLVLPHHAVHVDQADAPHECRVVLAGWRRGKRDARRNRPRKPRAGHAQTRGTCICSRRSRYGQFVPRNSAGTRGHSWRPPTSYAWHSGWRRHLEWRRVERWRLSPLHHRVRSHRSKRDDRRHALRRGGQESSRAWRRH
mmetsp:Transcript_25247/g.63537  ORF Transcript_25247/g.63537 Transcript_25247/m.63537 type:complete len:340 (+) Transcript_25247:1228-2247(+)